MPKEKGTFFITTPIYYPSDNLHIGHAYTTVAADALARYHRLRGEDVRFLTGTDEHGQKIERRARDAGLTPIRFVEPIVAGIKDLWGLLRIQEDDFLRTTQDRHRAVVAEVFRRIQAKGDIYLANYEGWYCTPCESFWPEGKLVAGNCPDCGRPVELAREESYFFRLSNYRDRLVAHLEEHPDFIQPPSRRAEMLSFLRSGLEDLCISRTSFRWGIPVPGNQAHVVYVWFDALANYLTGAGFLSDPMAFARYWPADVHLVGKEIVRFHAVIWPAMLMSLDLPLPRRVFGHGWLLFGADKMSKSKGNVIDPRSLITRYGVDPLRWYLLREIPFGADGSYTEDSFRRRINADLANDLGNLLHRTLGMVHRFVGGAVPAPSAPEPLAFLAEKTRAKVEVALDNLELSVACAAILDLVNDANLYIDRVAPWNLHKQKDPRLPNVLYSLLETIRLVGVLLSPFLVDTPARIWEQLGWTPTEPLTWAATTWGLLPPGGHLSTGHPIFPRLDDELEEEKKVGEAASDPTIPQIAIEEFAKVDLRVATVVAAEKVPKADRLLLLRVSLGNEERQIVSGIAQTYTAEDLIGKQVVLVANLKPAKFRGYESHGMLLAAGGSNGPVLLATSAPVEAGSRIK